MFISCTILTSSPPTALISLAAAQPRFSTTREPATRPGLSSPSWSSPQRSCFFTLLVIFSTIMLTRARVHRTTVEALQGPDTLNCLLVTPPPWDRLRALGQGCPLIKIPKTFLQTTVIQHNSKVHRRVKSSQCAGRTQCTSTATPTLDHQPGPPLFQAQATTGCLSINCVQRRSEHCAIFSK